MKKLEDYMDKYGSYTITKDVCQPYEIMWAWNKTTGSMDYYISRKIAEAIKANAPKDVTYYDEVEQRWHTLSEACDCTKRALENELAR